MGWISVITNEGNAMIAELAGGGHTLTFTKSCIGSGYVAAENMRVQTDLQSYKQDCAIAEIRAMTGGGGQNIRNRIGPATALVGAFIGHEIGVWAKVDNGEEKMFLLSQDIGTGVSVPLESSGADFFFDVVTPFLFFGSATIIATVDRTLYASLQDLDDATELLNENFAPEYDATETYYRGQYCVHEGILYSCTTLTKAPGPWSVIDWQRENVGANLNNILKYLLPAKADKENTVLTETLSRGRKSGTTAGTGSFAFGNNVEASGVYSFAEGDSTKASGRSSHAEGTDSQATEETAHAEGYDTKSSHISSHAEGSYTEASNYAAHAEGMSTKATGMSSHAEGDSSVASGESSHAEGCGTLASGDYQHAGGKYNISDPDGTYAEIIGNGSSSTRANARALDWNGNEYLKGDVYVNCDPDSDNGTALGAAVSALSSKLTPSSVSFTYASGVTSQTLFIRKSGNVVTVNGFVKFSSAPTVQTEIGTIAAGNRPDEAVRTNAVMAEQAYLVGENAYFTIGYDGVMRVTPKAGNTYTVMYISCSYIAQR